MNEIIKLSKNKYVYICFFVIIYLIGLILGIINYSQSYSYVFEAIGQEEKFELLFNNNYKYFFDSTYSIQNSLLYSLLLLLMTENKKSFLMVLNIIVSIILYIIFAIFIYKKKKSYLLSAGLLFLVFNIVFNDFRYLGIETKLIVIGFILFIFISKIRNKYLRYSLYFLNILLNFSTIYLIYFVVKLIISFYKKEVEILDIILSVILLFYNFIFIDIEIGISFSNITTLMLNSFNYNSESFSPRFKFLVPFGIIFLMLFNYLFLLYKDKSKIRIIEHIILFVSVLFFALLTIGDKANGCYDLKPYIILVFMDLLYLDYDLFTNSSSLNLYNDEKFNFDLSRIIYPVLLVCLTLGSFSFERNKEESFAYRIKYDCCYDITRNIFVYDDYFEKVNYEVISKFELYDEYVLPNNPSYQTFKSDKDIFIYGFGPQEDSNGSRWTRKYAALNLYAIKEDDLFINLYNPSNHTNLSISVYINNICFYKGKTKEGAETIKIIKPIKYNGNYIIRIVCDDLSGNTLDTDQYGFYVTNIAFSH